MFNPGISSPNNPFKELRDGPIAMEEEDEDDEHKRTIFCGNLDTRVTEELLYEVFLQAGPIDSVRIPKDNTGRQKTFGFITYVHKCSVPYAVKLLIGLSLFRKYLTIKAKDPPAGNPPSDVEKLQHQQNHRGGIDGGARDFIYDLRGNIFNGAANPFKRDSPPSKRIEWCSQRRSGELQKHSSHSLHHHQNSPYSRSDPSKDHGYHNRHSDNNRRSGQRNRHR